MALSQIQCLDDHHVNWRVSESKPEFFYSEDQRLALEALITRGRDAFTDYIQKRGGREFLSERELERVARTAEAYRPGDEHHARLEAAGPGNLTPGSGEDAEDGEVSLAYWPDRSEASVADLDLGWPDAVSYRGITRVTVYTQPPTEGHAHIKEVVRKSIASAQKVIAVVMDRFTDVDIFQDLLDASYKRRIPVYIILDMAAVPCFLSMCGRADMHRGHLKNLRVRCCGGLEFFTRSAQKIRGSLKEKFIFVDGDRAISGSYSFTWSSSRLDRNLITVITGQAVETFDMQFRDLFLTSRGVSLNKVPLKDEPVQEPLPQAVPAPVPASIARKLINPKYALVASGTHTSTTSSDQNSSKKESNSQNPAGLKVMKGRLKAVTEEAPLHPGLVDLGKANLIPYLPIWPEPDPPSDVIGFINIRDEKRAHQVHLQRSERFEVSQAIRFSAPLYQPVPTEESASNRDGKETQTEEKVPGNLKPTHPSPDVSAENKHEPQTGSNQDQTDSAASPQRPNTSPPEPQTSTSQPRLSAETPPAAPPVPKRRTLQLVIAPSPSQDSCEAKVTLIKMDQADKRHEEPSQKEAAPSRSLTSKNDSEDSGSKEGSQDSTKVICDRAVNKNPSSASTASDEEFYDSQLTNGGQTGSGRGPSHGDGLNVMARFSQSMLDLREPSQSEGGERASPQRHSGQISTSPAPDGRLRGPKAIIAKPGGLHRHSRMAGLVIGGHRYLQGHLAPPDSGLLHVEARSGRSPRRHSPSYRRRAPQPTADQMDLLGVSLSKLSSLTHLKSRAGTSQKKASQTNKAAR